MKKILVLFAAAFIAATLLSYTFKKKQPEFLSQECAISCFNMETRDLIQLDATKPGFAQLHENPKYFRLQNPLGTTVTFKAADQTDAQGYLIKSKKKSNK